MIQNVKDYEYLLEEPVERLKAALFLASVREDAKTRLESPKKRLIRDSLEQDDE